MSVIGPCLSIGVFVSVIVGMEFHCGYGWIGAAQSLSPYSGLPLVISMCLNMMPALSWETVRSHITADCAEYTTSHPLGQPSRWSVSLARYSMKNVRNVLGIRTCARNKKKYSSVDSEQM